ncbi:PPR containing plant-like protein [Medicago truncatula]|uniref:PPR containing plant-like protein n=1 Tax=Medicago truncatula TaxID=3880 RepID=G7ICY8_MEDTR|nr:PPR containing plant-like protein [Medicago truncatula]
MEIISWPICRSALLIGGVHARALFFSVPKLDIFLFNVLVCGFSLNDSPSSISLYIHLRRNTNLAPDNFTYDFAFAAYSNDKHLMLLHAHSIIDGYGSNLLVGEERVFGRKSSLTTPWRRAADGRKREGEIE